jgi:hypothetical protein
MGTNLITDLKAGAPAVELWFGLLLGPIAALGQLEANYALVLWVCRSDQDWPLHLVSLAAVIVTVFAAFLSHLNWRRLGGSWDDDGAGAVPRARLMAAIGILLNSLMLLVIIAQWIPVFMYGPCHR